MNSILIDKGKGRGELYVQLKSINGLVRKKNFGKYVEMFVIVEELFVFYFRLVNVYS